MDSVDNGTQVLERKITRLKELVKKYQLSLETQSALLALSEQASTVAELTLLYPAIQQILETSLPCQNFYVVLYNPDIGELELTYFIDEIDGLHLPIQAQEAGILTNSLTGYVFSSGQSQLLDKQQILECEIKGICHVMGTPCEYWLGVPIRHDGQVIGVMVTQSYNKNEPFSEEQITLFETVAFYFSTAVERVKKRQYLAQQVAERTEQLRLEVKRNQETIRKKSILYAISKLATTSLSSQEFYKKVHDIVNQEVYAKNLFIALFNETTNTISCPYVVDEVSSDYQTREFSKGLTEYVIKSGKTELFDQNRILQEVAKGEIELPKKFNDSPLPTSWVGVPLFNGQTVIGILACQTFRNEYSYKPSDIELLSFASEQIANVVIKHLADHQLEQRVKEKTAELQQANIHLQLQIEERKRIEQRLFHDANHDSLTGLANRSLFISQLDKTVQRHLRDETHCFAVMFIDLDNFKEINDNLGHQAGDQFLQRTAKAFTSCIREHDILARFGGDEFVILLTHLQHQDEAEQIAKRIIAVMDNPFCINDTCIKSGASIGIAHSYQGYKNTDTIIRDADSAMYHAKKAGKGVIKFSCNNKKSKDQLPLFESILKSSELSFSSCKLRSLATGNTVATFYKALLTHCSGTTISLDQLVENKLHSLNYREYLLQSVLPHLTQTQQIILNLDARLLDDDFELFKKALTQSEHTLCWLISYTTFAELSQVQLSYLEQLTSLGYQIGVYDVARNHLDIAKLTAVALDFVMLDVQFCRRLLSEQLAQRQLSALQAVFLNSRTQLVATGPEIVNFQISLQRLGLNLFLSQLSIDTEQSDTFDIKEISRQMDS